MEEQEILEGYKRKDPIWQHKLYADYSPLLYAICYRYTGDKNKAKDLMHDSFIKIFNNIKYFKHEGSFQGWMKRITVNTILTYFKKKDIIRMSEEITTEIENDVTDIKDDEIIPREKILEFITLLPNGYRTVFNMYAIEEYSHKEIAGLLNINIGTSLSQYSKARKMLAEMINDYLKK